MNPSHDTVRKAQVQLGALLARARVLREMTQEDLARECGVTGRAIQNMEAGKNTTLSTWLSAAHQLGYIQDILSVLKQDKPKTLEQAQALSERSFKRRMRVRK